MKICPKCGRKFERLLAVSRTDKKTMICDECGLLEALLSARKRDCGGKYGEQIQM